MSKEFINQVTLEYLVNKDYNVTIKPSTVDRRDKKFYRKRIFSLTKEFLNNEGPTDVFPEVKQAFDNYVKYCSNYFKVIDCSDILQEDYTDMSMNSLCNTSDLTESNQLQEDANKRMMRSIKIQPCTLDNFIKRSIQKENVVLPQQKDVNLSNPVLKLKGIQKSNKKKKYH